MSNQTDMTQDNAYAFASFTLSLTKNTEQLKQQVAEHIAADSVVQGGDYWDPETLKGCFIGCLAHGDDPSVNEKTYGLPIVVQRIAENIFEALPLDEAKAFFSALPDAVGCDGKDLSKVQWQFLAAELRSMPSQPNDIQAVIDPVIAGMDLLAQGLDWPTETRVVSWTTAATLAAAHAVDATDVADTSHAAHAAAATHAIAAATAQGPALMSASAELSSRLRQRDLLLQLIADAPVVG